MRCGEKRVAVMAVAVAMAVTVRRGAGDFIRFPTRSVRRTKGVTEKYPTVITVGFCNYTLRKCPEIHTYTAHIGAHRVWKRVSPLFPPAILSFRSFHLFTYNQRASPTLIPIKNEQNFTRYLRIMSINNFYDVMHTAPGFITTITLGLITYNKVHFHQKIWKKCY